MITELWEATPITNFTTSQVLVFTFTPIIVGQSPSIMSHAAGVFTETVTEVLNMRLSFIIQFTSNDSIGTDAQTEVSFTVKPEIFFTPSQTPIISTGAGVWKKTSHIISILSSAIGGTFSINVEKIFSGLLVSNISDVKLFVSDNK